jgi:hypothetical protein
LKTLTELAAHLEDHRLTGRPLPSYTDLAELCDPTNFDPASTESKLRKLYADVAKFDGFEFNYIHTCWVTFQNFKTITSLIPRQVEFINRLHLKHFGV